MNETDAMRDLMDKVAYAEARATLFERAFRLGPEATLIVRGADGAIMGFPGAQLVGRKKDGTEVPILVSLTPFHTETGVLIIVAVRQQPEDASAV